ncbi:MAG: HAMP domain-containing histidine kinase, partial [Vallitaleaceae bacterium]|nr:HAMP domain-containing histidine kinase [Vallitaleaceae bacterium]
SRTGHKGIGIGLTLVKSIVLLHQGSITYQPNHPTGTDFVIIIPYSPAFNKI